MVAKAKAQPKFWNLFKDGDWDYHLCNFVAPKKYNHIGQYLRYKKVIGIKENCEVLIEIYVIWHPASFLDFGTSPFSKGCQRTSMEQGFAPNLNCHMCLTHHGRVVMLFKKSAYLIISAVVWGSIPCVIFCFWLAKVLSHKVHMKSLRSPQ